MEKIKLNDEIIEQIKDFEWGNLTIKQSAIIEKLILNEELNRRYKDYGLCRECKQPKAGHYYNNYWCQSCNSKHFQEDFKNWTSGNHEVDKFIQSLQIKSNDCSEVLEWIEYDKLEKVEYLAKGGFGITYKAIWKDGYILDWNLENNQWERSKKSSKTYENYPVVLKCLHNSQDITAEFLREIESHIKIESIFVIRCHAYEVCTGLSPYHDIAHEVSLAINICRGLRPKSNYKIPQVILNIIKQCWDADPLKRPKANKLHNLLYNLYYSSNHEINNQIEQADEINEKLTTTSSLYTGIILSYTINSQAIYTSRLLDFKNLPEPKNDDEEEEYSESLMICYA
ncbi:uncharacterized protein OCT59_015203 [Rhizophagus irregularis]|uniref:uncharacterized protein n=1 Tax=Rhizophagus irregularis TaxID=588596 RepID=UPI00332747E5|nr:hypothetical protein OCT59_015203 [Rhizophagus irregularis]